MENHEKVAVVDHLNALRAKLQRYTPITGQRIHTNLYRVTIPELLRKNYKFPDNVAFTAPLERLQLKVLNSQNMRKLVRLVVSMTPSVGSTPHRFALEVRACRLATPKDKESMESFCIDPGTEFARYYAQFDFMPGAVNPIEHILFDTDQFVNIAKDPARRELFMLNPAVDKEGQSLEQFNVDYAMFGLHVQVFNMSNA